MGQTAVHLQSDALVEALCLHCVHAQKQFIRIMGIRVFPGVGKAYPDTFHIGAAGQLDTDGVIAGCGEF